MCGGGGGGGGNFLQMQLQANLAAAQMAQQQQLATQQLGEQQREFDIQQRQADESLARERELQAQQQAEADRQAALTNQWQSGRAAFQQQATNDIESAFSRFTPDYYNRFVQDYVGHYQPQIERQFGQAQTALNFGLARSGNLASQTAADQARELAIQKGQAEADISNKAIAEKTNLMDRATAAKQNLTSQALSDATLGSPITPGSADAIQASFNNTSSALAQIRNTAGDVITTLGAVPQYSSIGSLFGGLGQAIGSAVAGNQNYQFGQAFNNALGAANPTRSGSGRTY